MNIAEYKALSRKAKNKYHAQKTKINGIEFDSKAEAKRYCELLMLERAGKIKDLELQPKYELQEGFWRDGKKIQAITYIADFAYYEVDTEKDIVEDVKGVRTKDFNIKRKMFLFKYPWLELRLI